MASFGTIRALAMLALLYDPHPPKLTCVEEIDHGFHPHLFDRLVELLREATARTQLLIATHSPALVNRLRPEELIVCERNPENGGVRIPAVEPEKITQMVEATGGALGPGELWFSGSLGGVP
jgi:predicted ATPase